MKPTVREIAKAAGVSIASVSLVLNDKPSRITDETKLKILETAKEMGYQSRKRIRTEKVGQILGVVSPLEDDGMINEALKGIFQYAAMHQIRVITILMKDSTERELESLAILRKIGAAGVIVIPPLDMNDEENNVRWRESLEELGIPFVLLNQAIDRVFCDFVTGDNKSGGYMAAEYLIHKGCKKIGVLAGKRDVYTIRKRIEGYKEALAFYGISINEEWIIYNNTWEQAGYLGMEHLAGAGVEAVIICNEELLIGVHQFLKEHALKPGAKITTAGFCDTAAVSYFWSSLTTIRQPSERMGGKACEVLLKRITGEDKEAVRTTYFTPELVEGVGGSA